MHTHMTTTSVDVGNYSSIRVIHTQVGIHNTCIASLQVCTAIYIVCIFTINFGDFSQTYSQCNAMHSLTGVRDEAAKFVKALTMNTDLQKAFTALLQKPDNNLLKLSKEVRPRYLIELYTWDGVGIHLSN